MAKGQPRSRVLPPMPGQEQAAARPEAEAPAHETADDTAVIPTDAPAAKPGTPGKATKATKATKAVTADQPEPAPVADEPTSREDTSVAAARAAWSAPPVRTSSRPTSRPWREPRPESDGRSRTAQLRLVQVDPWSVMKTAFLLSIAIGIISVVAVGIIWGILGAAGVWDSVNSTVQQTVGSDSGKPFDITDYIGASRVLGFTMIAAVIDVVLITAIATLGAFIYNLAATLVGGIEVTLSEER